MGKSKLNAATKVMKPPTTDPVEVEEEKGDELDILEEEQEQPSDNSILADESTIAYLWLLVFSVLMFTFPFITFYGVRTWLNEAFDITEFYVNCWAVLASVLVVNIIICMYVFKAFREDVRPLPATSASAAEPMLAEQKKSK